MGRFVRPETTVLTLEDGATVTIRRRLNIGQQTTRLARVYTAVADDPGGATINMLEVGRSTVLAYLLDWSLVDDDGAPVVIRGLDVLELGAVLDTLAPDAFRELRDAINGHEARTAAALEAEKKTIRPGGIGSVTLSESPAGVAGGTSG